MFWKATCCCHTLSIWSNHHSLVMTFLHQVLVLQWGHFKYLVLAICIPIVYCINVGVNSSLQFLHLKYPIFLSPHIATYRPTLNTLIAITISTILIGNVITSVWKQTTNSNVTNVIVDITPIIVVNNIFCLFSSFSLIIFTIFSSAFFL